MALIMYLTRAPRYDNTTAKEIMLIEDFLHWRHENKNKSRYSCESFEQWGGVPESELPDKYTIEYYRQFLTKKSIYVEGIGQQTCDSIFEQLARIVKAKKPKIVFLENVKNFEKHNEGKTLERAKKELQRIGYNVYSKVLCASDYGISGILAVGAFEALADYCRHRSFFRHYFLLGQSLLIGFPGF